MDGPQDLGGRHGFGPVLPERDEPLFHAAWERETFNLVLAMGATGAWSIDESRHARERMAPARYLAASYYEIWLEGLERLVAEKGLASASEIASGAMLEAPRPVPRVLAAGDVAAALARGASTARDGAAPRFKVGGRVTTRLLHTEGHTRLPAYARGRPGTIAASHGCHVFADRRGNGAGEEPQPLYTVAFRARDLFGPGAGAADTITLDLFEPYLDPA